MESIDHFKYMALLAELESIKNSKGPITKFISKIFIISNRLSSNLNYRETIRYAFMLITRAISYSGATRKCTTEIQKRLEETARNILHWEILTPDNILSTYDFWEVGLQFYPDSLNELVHIEELLKVINETKIFTITTYLIKESNIVAAHSGAIIRFHLLGTIGKESLILKYLEKSNPNYILESKKLIPKLEEQINRFQIILKEANEHHSRSITTV